MAPLPPTTTKTLIITAEIFGFLTLLTALYVAYRIFAMRSCKDKEQPKDEKGNIPISFPSPTSPNSQKPLPSFPPPMRPQRPPEPFLPVRPERTLRRPSYWGNGPDPLDAHVRPTVADV